MSTKRFFIIAAAALVLLAVVLAVACAPAAQPTIVPAGRIFVTYNSTYDPGKNQDLASRYASLKYVGETLVKDVAYDQLESAVVGPNQIGYYGKNVLVPGAYPRYPKQDVQLKDMLIVSANAVAVNIKDGSVMEAGRHEESLLEDYRIVTAAVVGANQFGVERKVTGGTASYGILYQGAYPTPAENVKLFPYGEQRYRLLDGSLYDNAKSKFQEPACSSFMCEFPMDNVSLSGTDLKGTVTLDVLFRFLDRQEYAARLWEIGSPEQAVQNYLGTPLRSQGRGSSSDLKADDIKTGSSRTTLEGRYLELMLGAQKSQPISVTKVAIRSVIVGSKEYETQQAARAAEIEAEKGNGLLLNEKLTNQGKQQTFDGNANDFRRAQAIADADTQAQVNEKALKPFASIDAFKLWVLEFGGKIQPFVNDAGKIIPIPITTPTPKP